MNLFWSNQTSTYFNPAFAKSALTYSIAQADNLLQNRDSKDERKFLKNHPIKVESIFVKSGLFAETDWNDEDSENSKELLVSEALVKRLLLEFQNNQKVFLYIGLKRFIEKFYFPLRHVDVNVLNDLIVDSWPSKLNWVDYARKLDLIVVNPTGLDANGRIVLDKTKQMDCLALDLINQSVGKRVKVIALVEFGDYFVEDFKNTNGDLNKIVERRPDLVISNKGVFEYNQSSERFELVEFVNGSDLDRGNIPFEFDVDEDKVRLIRYECI